MRSTFAQGLLTLAAFGLFGCEAAQPAVAPPSQSRNTPATPTPKPIYSAEPRSAPSALPTVRPDWPTLQGGPGRVSEDFEGAEAAMADWKDPRDEGYRFPWLYSGSWAIVAAFQPPPTPRALPARERDLAAVGARALEFNDMRPQPMLSFRRYAGKAFGTPDGELPERYSVSLAVRPLASRDDFFPPVGDLGTPVYYVDPTHYVEVLIKPDHFEVWECNGGEPLQWHGWRQLYDEAASHSAGVAVMIGAEVNSRTGAIKVYRQGQLRREVKSDVVKPYTHYFALRAGSNRVQFDDLTIASQ